MSGLSFADTRYGQRVIGNKINTGYLMPEGWNNSAPTDPTWKMGGSEGKADWALLVLQPDTSLDLKPATCSVHTYVQMFKKTEELVEVLQAQSIEQLQKVMSLSEKTAKSHMERFQNFHKLPPKQACLIFGGEALRAADFSDSERKFVEAHLRFISGLYGVLRPYDDVKPVRDVPMGADLETKRGKTVVDFWGDMLTKQLAKDASSGSGKKPLLVLAVTDEYARAVQLEALPKDLQVVRIIFEGGPEAAARLARGLFGHFFVRKRLGSADDLKDFDSDDWALEKFKCTGSRVVYAWVGDAPKKSKKHKKQDGKKAEKKADGSPHASPSRGSRSGSAAAKGRQASRRRDGSSSCSRRRRAKKGAAKGTEERSRSRGRRGRDARARRSEASPRRSRKRSESP